MEALSGLLSVVWLLLFLCLICTFVRSARRAIAREILAPYHIPLRRFRWMVGISAVAAFIAIVSIAHESPKQQSSPSAAATTAAAPVALVTPAPAGSDTSSQATTARATSAGISKAAFDRIETGMTYGEVRNLIGQDGEELSHTDMAGISVSIYMWRNWTGSNMNVTFQDDRVMAKAQFGLN